MISLVIRYEGALRGLQIHTQRTVRMLQNESPGFAYSYFMRHGRPWLGRYFTLESYQQAPHSCAIEGWHHRVLMFSCKLLRDWILRS